LSFPKALQQVNGSELLSKKFLFHIKPKNLNTMKNIIKNTG